MCAKDVKAQWERENLLRPPGSVVYIGHRCADNAEVFVWSDSGLKKLRMRNRIRNHSPNGPEWGYGGSGPAQLALALCCEVLSETLALEVYQQFKAALVSRLPKDGWRLDGRELVGAVLSVVREVLLVPPPPVDPGDYPAACNGGRLT